MPKPRLTDTNGQGRNRAQQSGLGRDYAAVQ